VGNQKLRDLVFRYVPQYLNAQSKTEKGRVIAAIIAETRRESPTGTGLVRQCPKTLRWSYIGLDKAKDKIGHALRKAAQEYGRKEAKHNGNSTTHIMLPHSASSSLSSQLDSTTTATRSMSSSDSDHEDEDVTARDRYRIDSSGSYRYPAAHHGSAYPHSVYHPPAMSDYAASSREYMMYYYPGPEAHSHHHRMAYLAYLQDPAAAVSYHHPYYYAPQHPHYYPPLNTSVPYEHSPQHYDHPHGSHAYDYNYTLKEEPLTHRVPSYPQYSSETPANGFRHESSPAVGLPKNHIPILPHYESGRTPERPDPWARAIQEPIQTRGETF
jgi:hypothetical protein